MHGQTDKYKIYRHRYELDTDRHRYELDTDRQRYEVYTDRQRDKQADRQIEKYIDAQRYTQQRHTKRWALIVLVYRQRLSGV